MYFKLASDDLSSFKTSFGTSKHTYPIKSHNLRRHFFSKATGTSQPDHCFFFSWWHLNLCGFTLSTKWKSETLEVAPNPQFSGQVGQEIDLEPKNLCIEGLLDTALRNDTCGRKRGEENWQRKLWGDPLKLSGIERRGLGVCVLTKRIPSPWKQAGLREEFPWVEIIPREEKEFHWCVFSNLRNKWLDPKKWSNGISHPFQSSYPKKVKFPEMPGF